MHGFVDLHTNMYEDLQSLHSATIHVTSWCGKYFPLPAHNSIIVKARAHKNRRLEEECVTPIEARSPGKIIEPY